MAKAQAFSGTVSRLSTKDWADRDSGENIVLRSFQMEETGNRWFRTGTHDPELIQVGNTVKFVANSQNNNVDVNSIEATEEVVAKAPPVRKAVGTARANNTGYKGYQSKNQFFDAKDAYWDKKEQRDLEKDERYQTVDIPRMTFCTAQDAAVALVTSALQHDALALGSKSKADKLDLLLGHVDQVTQRFFAQRMAANVSGDTELVSSREADKGEDDNDDDGNIE